MLAVGHVSVSSKYSMTPFLFGRSYMMLVHDVYAS